MKFAFSCIPFFFVIPLICWAHFNKKGLNQKNDYAPYEKYRLLSIQMTYSSLCVEKYKHHRIKRVYFSKNKACAKTYIHMYIKAATVAIMYADI